MSFAYAVVVPRVAAACVCAALVAGCGKKEVAQSERPPTPVTTAIAVARDVPHYLDAVGKIVAREVVSIQPQVGGRITQIHFTDGADVKVGDLLFTIDPRPYQAQLQQAEANLAQAEAALSLARISFNRIEGVSDPRAVSRQDYDTKKSGVAAAEASVKQNLAAVASARLNLEYCTIRSPIAGRTGQRAIDVGNVVSPNGGSLLVIQRLDPIYADFTVTESELSVVQRHMARRDLRVEVQLPDETMAPRAGHLTFLDNAVQDGTGTVKLRATLANDDRRFWPGRFAKVRLVLEILRDAVLIPAEAPQLSAKGSFVFVVKDDSTAELRPVKLGQRHGDAIVIEEGVKSGERVIVKGQLGVTPGGKVTVSDSRSNGSTVQPKLQGGVPAKSGAR